jgi:hypothetical protein
MATMKNNLIIIVFLIAIIVSPLKADYTTPGANKAWNLDSLVANSSGAVTLTSGIYYFNTNININQTDTLKILTNAIVKVDSAKLFTIYGTLIINPPDSVKFTAIDTNKKFVGIRLDSLSDSSLMKRLIFEYANSIYFFNSNALLDSSIIRYNSYWTSSLRSGAIYMYSSNPTISNCKIFGSYRSAIGSGANIASSPQILNNLIYGNNISNGNYPQINMGAAGTQTLIIRGNQILRASTNSGAIAFLPVGSIPNLIIENNIIKNNRFGIALLAGGINAYINNNTIDSNNTQGSPALGGSGLNFAGNWSSSSVIVTRNTIRWNLWGVTIQNTAKPNIGNVFNTDTADNGNNNIYYNSNSGKYYDLYNNTPDTIKAENNYWGTNILDSIEAHIFHKADSSALGFVDYIPFVSPTGMTINPEVKIDYYEYLNVYPNPFNPDVLLRFNLKNPGYVRIKVFDIAGREISQIAGGLLNAGIHERNWNSKGLSSGVYIIRLETPDNILAKRVAIIK